MTLEEFRKTKRFSWVSLGDWIGNETSNPGFIYKNYLYIELLTEGEHTGKFSLHIDNMDWLSETLAPLETRLYDLWKITYDRS